MVEITLEVGMNQNKMAGSPKDKGGSYRSGQYEQKYKDMKIDDSRMNQFGRKYKVQKEEE